MPRYKRQRSRRWAQASSQSLRGEAGGESTLRGEAGARSDLPGTICCVVRHLQRTAFLLGAAAAGAGAGAGAAVGEKGAAGACRRKYCSLSRTVPIHWQAFLPVLLAPDGGLSALRVVRGPALEAESGGGDARGRTGPLGARLVVVAALQKLRTGTIAVAATCRCTSVRFSV